MSSPLIVPPPGPCPKEANLAYEWMDDQKDTVWSKLDYGILSSHRVATLQTLGHDRQYFVRDDDEFSVCTRYTGVPWRVL